MRSAMRRAASRSWPMVQSAVRLLPSAFRRGFVAAGLDFGTHTPCSPRSSWWFSMPGAPEPQRGRLGAGRAGGREFSPAGLAVLDAAAPGSRSQGLRYRGAAAAEAVLEQTAARRMDDCLPTLLIAKRAVRTDVTLQEIAACLLRHTCRHPAHMRLGIRPPSSRSSTAGT